MIISIVIATYNASKTLKRCLDSIVPQLTSDSELVIIDGGSIDDTNQIIESYGNKISVHVSEPDQGIYDAWNKGIKLSTGDWVMFLGADDMLLPDALHFYIEEVAKTEGISEFDYICAQNEYAKSDGTIIQIIGDKPVWYGFKEHMLAAHVASLHNRSNLFYKVGLYDLNYKICADYELLLRKKNSLKWMFVERTIAKMTIGGMSFSIKAIYETYKIRKQHKTIPNLNNFFIFIRDICALKTFTLRKYIFK